MAEYVDKIQEGKISIDGKDPQAYSDDAFIKDIYVQLKLAPVESFAQEHERNETRWLTGKDVVTSVSLIEDATVHYTQLDNTGRWKGRHNPKDQIISLMTQVSALTTEVTNLKKTPTETSNAGSTPSGSTSSGVKTGGFEMWRPTKVDNGNEHSMVEKNGRKYYFCEDGHSFDRKACGMYCFHKPGAEHVTWKERK